MACQSIDEVGVDCSATPTDPSCSSNTAALPPPSHVVATALTIDKIKIEWKNPNVTNDFSIVLEIKEPGAANYTLLKKITDESEAYEASDLQSASMYSFRLKTKSGSKTSIYSPEVSATTKAQVINPAFPIPTNIVASNYAAGKIKLSHSWSNTNYQYFLVIKYFHKSLTGGNWVVFTPSSNGSYLSDDAPLPGNNVYKMEVTYSDLSTYTSGTSNPIAAVLEIPTNLVGTSVSLNGLPAHHLEWNYGLNTVTQSGYVITWGISGIGAGTVYINSNGVKAHTFLPNLCSAGNQVAYWVSAKSNNAYVIDSPVSDPIIMNCP